MYHEWNIKKSLLLLYHHTYCDPETEFESEDKKLINSISETIYDDIHEVVEILTNRKNK
jgi:hypothetical protein